MHILLTGASGGIGKAASEALQKNGHRVHELTHQDADLGSLKDIRKLGEKFSTEGTIFDWIIFAHGYIDFETDFLKQDPENIEKTFSVNTLSCIYLTQLLLSHLSKGVIFISSTAGINPNGHIAAYSASKAALNAFAQAMARNKPEFTFISLCPGATNTPMRENLAHDAAKQQSPAAIAETINEILREGSPYKSGDIIVVKDAAASISSQV